MWEFKCFNITLSYECLNFSYPLCMYSSHLLVLCQCEICSLGSVLKLMNCPCKWYGKNWNYHFWDFIIKYCYFCFATSLSLFLVTCFLWWSKSPPFKLPYVLIHVPTKVLKEISVFFNWISFMEVSLIFNIILLSIYNIVVQYFIIMLHLKLLQNNCYIPYAAQHICIAYFLYIVVCVF